MFWRSQKDRAAEALHRGIKAILIGGFFHYEHSQQFALNKQASAWLYTEAIAHQVYVLTAIFHNTAGKTYEWATRDFMMKAMSEAMVNFELQQGTVPGGISSFAFRRCAEIDALTPQERTTGKQFEQSAARIAELDPSADTRAIAAKFDEVTSKFFECALPMFR